MWHSSVKYFLAKLHQFSMALAVTNNLIQVSKVIGAANLVGFGITALFETHKITDLVGAGSFVAGSAILLLKTKMDLSNLRSLIMNGSVIAWGARLSSFLFYRVLTLGEDKRLHDFFRAKDEKFLDASKSFFPIKLFSFWAIQAGWGIICLLPVTITSSLPAIKMGPLSYISAAILLSGIAIESVADYQKYIFKQKNKEKWCDVGLWALARHPNCK